MGAVSDAWDRIDDWLGRHAPASATMLAGPADPAAVAAAESTLGLSFPAELTESLRRHDGLVDWANVLPEAAPLGVAGIVAQRQERMEIAGSVNGFTPPWPGAETWWHKSWLPFADAEGDLQVIDLRPGPARGRIGVAVHDGVADFEDGWPSLGAYLTAVADALDNGGPVGEWHAFLTAGGDLWWSLAGDTELNGEPLRPAPHG